MAALIALVAATVTAEAATRANPLAGERLFLNSDTQAAADVQGLQNENPELANRLKAISESPQAIWLTTGGQETKRRVARAMKASGSSKSVPVFVAYNIPARDCGSFSAGGAKGAKAYSRFVATIAKTIGRRRAAVVMEPDAIAGLDCLSKKKQRARLALIKKSVRTLEKRPKLAVYIDAGHSVWKPGQHDGEAPASRPASPRPTASRSTSRTTTARRTRSPSARGSARRPRASTSSSTPAATARAPRRTTSGATRPAARSANGRGPPTPASKRVDALLWIKAPGESDGTCNGGPPAGEWWRDYALGLIERSG